MAGPKLSRRALLQGALASLGILALPRAARAFGDEGAFHPRPLLTGSSRLEGVRSSAPARWARELRNRTSAPSRLDPAPVRADDPALLAEPFVYWLGDREVGELSVAEVAGLRRFFSQGGVMFVDDGNPESGAFLRSVKRELSRVLPDAAPLPLGQDHVIFHSFYLLRRPVGRVEGPSHLEGIVRGGQAQVVLSSHDVAGALARGPSGIWSVPVSPRGEEQREHAIRLAVNIAMYVLCSTYKDDQVHAPSLMRRRALDNP